MLCYANIRFYQGPRKYLFLLLWYSELWLRRTRDSRIFKTFFKVPNCVTRGGNFSHSAYVYLIWGPVTLRLTLGRAPLCIQLIGTERRAQARPLSSIFLTRWALDRTLSSTSGLLQLRWVVGPIHNGCGIAFWILYGAELQTLDGNVVLFRAYEESTG